MHIFSLTSVHLKIKTPRMPKNKITILHLKYLNLPLDNRFEDHIQQVIDRVVLTFKLKYKTQNKIIEGYQYTARAIIEGLYQIYGSRNKNSRLGTPTSKSGYGNKPYQISDHSHIVVKRILAALQSLDWVNYRKGFKNWDDEKIPTSIRPIGQLLNDFKASKFVWRHMGPLTSDVIVLKGYDPKTKSKEIITFKNNDQIRNWRKNLQSINIFFSQNAICLNLHELHLELMIKIMANNEYEVDWMLGENKKKPRMFNFLNVQLRRIFARGRFDYGGRFYGGWWQFIPSEYRSYITINGHQTTEIDYSELHPRLMYLNAGLEFPDGDLYDLGLRYDDIKYNKDVEPYKTKRKTIKKYINATINDDNGTFKIFGKELKKFGMKHEELDELVVKRHPIIEEIKGKGLGLQFQFIDSQIAEKVMMEMMRRGKVCLPVHDSFICELEHEQELRQIMHDAYVEIVKDIPKMKEASEPQTDYETGYYPSGEIDLTYTRNMYEQDIHHEYLTTYLEYKYGKGRGTRST